MAKKHVQQEPTRHGTKAIIIAHGFKDVVNYLRRELLAAGCQVEISSTERLRRVASYNYVIFVAPSSIPRGCETIIKNASPRILFVDSAEQGCGKKIYSWLRSIKRYYDVRYTVLRDTTECDGLLTLLFGYGEDGDLTAIPILSPGKIKKGQRSKKVCPVNSLGSSDANAKDAVKIHLPNLPIERRLLIPRPNSIITLGLIFILLLTVLAPFLIFTYKFGLGIHGLLKLAPQVAHANIEEEQLNSTESNLKGAHSILTRGVEIFSPLEQFPGISTLENMLSLGESVSALARQIIALSQLGKDVSASLMTSDSRPLTVTLQYIEKELTLVEGNLAIAQEKLSKLRNWSLLSLPWFGDIDDNLDGGIRTLAEVEGSVRLARIIIPTLPEVLGENERRSYLLLFQNNTELRPGGGFIGSFGIVSFENGRLIDLSIEDVYTADGQLRGHVDPPDPIRKFLGQPHWYLRDSNFDPDFPSSARQVEWFLKKEMDIDVNGTIAMDLTFAQKLIEALGSVYLADYNKMITGDNLFLTLQSHVQRNFFPGSTRKRDFLGSLSRTLLLELTTNTNLPWMKVTSAVSSSLEEKHLLLALHDPKIQGIVDNAGWSGSMHSVSCVEKVSPCIGDYFAVSEANLGVNKANAYVSRDMQHTVRFSDAILYHKVLITYNNKSSSVFPAGEYKSYLRAFLPSYATITSVRVGDKNLAMAEGEQKRYQDKKMLGFLLTVPSRQSRRVELRYTLPSPKTGTELLYQLYLQKQPGTMADPVNLLVNTQHRRLLQANFPISLAMGSRASYNAKTNQKVKGLQSNESHRYQTDLSIDRVFRITVSAK